MKIEPLEFGAARSEEVRSLCDSLGAVGYCALHSSAQRRTTSHKPSKHRRRPNEKRKRLRQGAGAADGASAVIPESREARRRKKLQDIKNSVRVSDEVRYLESHLWHAKRQKMVKIWGHHLAQGARGKGLGIAGFCRTISSGLFVHDMSYFWSFRLEGPIEGLLRVLAGACTETAVPTKEDLERRTQSFELEGTFLKASEGEGIPEACRCALSPVLITWVRHPHPKAALPGAGGPTYSPLVWAHCHAYGKIRAELERAAARDGRVKVECPESAVKRVEVRGSKSLEAALKALGVPREVIARAGKGDAELLRLLDPRLRGAVAKGEKFSHPDRRAQGREAISRLLMAPGREEACARLDAFGRRPMGEDAVGRLNRRAGLLHDVPAALEDEEWGENATFPAVLVRKGEGRGPLGGFSLLFPKTWTHPLWMALAGAKARGAGLREWKWYAQICGRGIFPDSYPDAGIGGEESVERATNASAAGEGEAWPAGILVARPTGPKGAGIGGLEGLEGPGRLARVALRPAGRGTPESWSRVLRATVEDLRVFRASGAAAYDSGEEREVLGRVTLGVLPKKCKGFAISAEAFCDVSGLLESAREQQVPAGGAEGVLVMLVCKEGKGNKGTVRPAIATLATWT